MSSDMELAELLAARLCHDLVGPVSAVSNGVELLQGATTVDPEVNALIASSARQAARRLQWFRAAFGSGAGLPAGALLKESRRLVETLTEETQVKLDWPAPDAGSEASASRTAAKVALNLGLVAIECLPRGGTVRVRIGSPDPLSLEFAASGTGAKIPDDVRTALAGAAPARDIAPRGAAAYLAARLAATAGGCVNVTEGAERVGLVATLPQRPEKG
jgi:histidine phosphotransferase ChpT